jgi:hypothetical protein
VQPSLRFLLNRFAEWNCELSADANSNFYRLKCFCHCLLSRAHKAGEMGKKGFSIAFDEEHKSKRELTTRLTLLGIFFIRSPLPFCRSENSSKTCFEVFISAPAECGA